MPDLPDDLRDMLHERAAHAPATPAPTDALVRRVRRRRATRATLALSTSLAGVAAVAVAAVAVQPGERAIAPVAPRPSLTPDATPGDRYEFCQGPVYDAVHVSVHATELKFARGCYEVKAGATGITFTNPQVGVAHDLVITREGEDTPVYRSATLVPTGPDAGVTDTYRPGFAAGDYTLTCSTHREMHAQLVVR